MLLIKEAAILLSTRLSTLTSRPLLFTRPNPNLSSNFSTGDYRINSISTLRQIQRSLIRPASTTITTIAAHDRSQPLRQSFANENIKEKINLEVKRAQERILTVPNVLTVSRIASTPFVGYFLWNGMTTPALACFAFAAVTDLLDGYIARRFNQNSDIGAILDPVADKLLLMTCFVSMCHTGLMPFWLVRGFIIRDLILLLGGASIRYFSFDDHTSWRKILDFKNYPTLGFEPTILSKCNTALQCSLVAIGLGTNHLVGVPLFDWSLFSLQCVTAGTTAASLAQYIFRFADPTDNHRKFIRKSS